MPPGFHVSSFSRDAAVDAGRKSTGFCFRDGVGSFGCSFWRRPVGISASGKNLPRYHVAPCCRARLQARWKLLFWTCENLGTLWFGPKPTGSGSPRFADWWMKACSQSDALVAAVALQQPSPWPTCNWGDVNSRILRCLHWWESLMSLLHAWVPGIGTGLHLIRLALRRRPKTAVQYGTKERMSACPTSIPVIKKVILVVPKNQGIRCPAGLTGPRSSSWKTATPMIRSQWYWFVVNFSNEYKSRTPMALERETRSWGKQLQQSPRLPQPWVHHWGAEGLYVCVCMCMCMCVCVCVCVSVYVWMCVCVYVCMCMYVYVCICM